MFYMDIQLMPEVKRIINYNNEINIGFELNILLDKDNYYNIKPAINFLKTKINVNYSNEIMGGYNLITKRISSEELLHKSNEPINNEVIEQSYILDIKKGETIIYYTGAEGLNYAFLTFGQLLDQKLNWDLNSMKIIDYPSVENRGLMLDVSRGKVPKLKTIYKIIDILYLYKMNIFQVYIEDAYFFPSHPKIGEKKRRLTEEDIIKINRYCKQRAIEFQPNLQTFSHAHGILRIPEYKDLSENDDLWTIAPLKDETYQLLDDLIKNLLKGFESKTMHINMDEAYDIGTGYSKDICNEIGKEQVYLKHLDKVIDITKQYGINNTLIWSDMFNKYPELLKELDESIIPIYWDYSPNEDYSNMKHYEDLEFWVAPGTSSWNSIFPRMKNAFSNINNIIDAGYKHGTNGVLLTDWGDYGHMQSIGLSFPGYIYAAEKSWSLNELTYDDFLSRMEFFDFFTKDQLELLRILETSNEGLTDAFKTKSLYSLFDDIIKGKSIKGVQGIDSLDKSDFIKLYSVGVKGLQVSKNLDSTILSKEMTLSAMKVKLTGEKGLLSNEIRERFANKTVDENFILETINKIKMLSQKVEKIRGLHSELWMERSYFEGFENISYLYSKLINQLSESAIWLNEQRENILGSKEVDNDFSTYMAADNFTTLWSQDFDNIWDIAYPWS